MPGEKSDQQNEGEGDEECLRTILPPQTDGEVHNRSMENIDAIGEVSYLPKLIQEGKSEGEEIDGHPHRERTEEFHIPGFQRQDE